MITYSKFLIYGFFILCFSSLYSMEDIKNLPNDIVRDMIIKYQIDEASIYLAQLLHLPRTKIQKKFSRSLKKYKNNLEAYHNPGSRFITDIKETNLKMEQITNMLNYTTKIYGKKSEPYKVLLSSLKIQEHLIKNYEKSIQEEKFENSILAQNNLKKMTFILEALFLTAISEEELAENRKLYRQLSLQFHSDKTANDTKEIQKQKSDFFGTTIEPLLSSNKKDNSLENIVKSIREKRDAIIEQINNPSILNQTTQFCCTITLPSIGQGLGIALCNKTFAKLMPRSAGENDAHNACITAARKTALEIETKLIKLSHRL